MYYGEILSTTLPEVSLKRVNQVILMKSILLSISGKNLLYQPPPITYLKQTKIQPN